MSRTWQVVRRLLFTRPLILGLLSLFYITACVLPDFGSPETRSIGLVFLCAIPTVGIFALVTERLRGLCANALELGIPRHTTTVQRAQLVIIATVVGIPLLLIARGGGSVLAIATMLFAAALLGIIVVLYGAVAFGLYVAFAVVGAKDFMRWEWIAHPATQCAGLIVSAVFLVRWYLLPSQLQKNPAASAAVYLSWNQSLSRAPASPLPAVVDADGVLADPDIELATREVTLKGPSHRSLALGIAVNVMPRMKSVLYVSAFVGAALIFWHFFHGAKPEAVGYWIATAVAALTTISRVSSIQERWRATTEEQSLLKLTPRWPDETRVKILFLSLIGWAQVSSWVAWLLFTPLAWALGAISGPDAMVAGVAMLATSCASAASLCAVLARRSVRQVHASTLIIALTSIVAAAVFALYTLNPPSRVFPRIVTVLVILAPLMVALSALMLRRLQFPVSRAAIR